MPAAKKSSSATATEEKKPIDPVETSGSDSPEGNFNKVDLPEPLPGSAAEVANLGPSLSPSAEEFTPNFGQGLKPMRFEEDSQPQEDMVVVLFDPKIMQEFNTVRLELMVVFKGDDIVLSNGQRHPNYTTKKSVLEPGLQMVPRSYWESWETSSSRITKAAVRYEVVSKVLDSPEDIEDVSTREKIRLIRDCNTESSLKLLALWQKLRGMKSEQIQGEILKKQKAMGVGLPVGAQQGNGDSFGSLRPMMFAAEQQN